MNVSYIKRRYQGVDMFIGRKKLAEDSLGKHNQKTGFLNALVSPRMPMSQTIRNSMAAPSDVLKMNSTNYENLARNSQSIGFPNASITTGLESNN